MPPVALTYNSSTFTYSGSFTINPAYALNFNATAQISSGSQPYSANYRIIGAQYSSSGPHINEGVQQTPLKRAAPSGWSLFPAESMAAISVDATSLANNTGIVVGQTNMPTDAPSGKLAVGGPYYVQGDHPILADTGLSFNFQADYFCGLQANSVSIYRYNGTGWTAVDTSIDTNWNQAYASLTQWGIYAVFATANDQCLLRLHRAHGFTRHHRRLPLRRGGRAVRQPAQALLPPRLRCDQGPAKQDDLPDGAA